MDREQAARLLAAPRRGWAESDWPFIAAQCAMMHSFPHYLRDEIARAVRHGMPADTWSTVRFNRGVVDWRYPFRLASAHPETARRLTLAAAERFPDSEVVRAAIVLYLRHDRG